MGCKCVNWTLALVLLNQVWSGNTANWFPKSDVQTTVSYVFTMWGFFCFFVCFYCFFLFLCFHSLFFVYFGTIYIINNLTVRSKPAVYYRALRLSATIKRYPAEACMSMVRSRFLSSFLTGLYLVIVTTREAAWYCFRWLCLSECVCLSVCMYVCMCLCVLFYGLYAWNNDIHTYIQYDNFRKP